MKKLFIGILTLATTAAFGQIRRGNDIVIKPQFGIYGGLSAANQLEGGYSDNSIAGGIVGIQAAFPISYDWFVQPEITYSNMGTQYYNNNSDNYNGKVNLHMNYVSVPVLFKWSMPFTGFGIFFGPQYGYLIAANQKPAGYQSNQYDKENIIDSGYYHKSDFSGVLGLEYYFPNNGYYKGPKFGISLRYQFGFVNVNNGASVDDYGGYPTILNNGFFITAGIRF